MPEEEHYLMSKEEITEQIVTLLSGRTAEEIIFNTITTGAANDIERATELARAMVTKFGMSESFDMMALEKNSNMYLEGKTAMLCSDTTGSKADYEALEIIKDCHKKATELLSANIDKLHKIAAFLIEKETITGEQFMELFNEKDEQSEENNITEE